MVMQELPVKVVKSVKSYDEGMSCHMAVSSTYGIDNNSPLKLTEALYKILGDRRACGAVVGALKVIDNHKDNFTSEEKQELTAKLIMRTYNELGDLSCSVLMHYQHKKEIERRISGATGIKHFKPCTILVGEVVNILEEVIEEHKTNMND